MVNITGTYSSKKPLFTRGAFGKYSNFSTRVGLCMPVECNETDLAKLNPYYQSMAINAGWENDSLLNVSYRFSSRDDTVQASQPMSAGMTVVVASIIIMMVLGIAGTVIELNKIGDIPDLDYKRL